MTARDPRPFDLALIERYEAHDWPDEAQGKQIMRLCWLARRGLDAAPAPAAEPAVSDTLHYGGNGMSGAPAAEPRPCTCHPDDNPPRPCPQKFALTECRAAAELPACPPCYGSTNECGDNGCIDKASKPPQDVAGLLTLIKRLREFYDRRGTMMATEQDKLCRDAAAALAALAKERGTVHAAWMSTSKALERAERERDDYRETARDLDASLNREIERAEQAERERDDLAQQRRMAVMSMREQGERAEQAEAQFKSLREATRTEWLDLWNRAAQAERERDECAQEYARESYALRRAVERAELAERERDEARALLLRWLQAHNKMDGRSGLSVAEFDKLRQDTHAARAK